MLLPMQGTQLVSSTGMQILERDLQRAILQSALAQVVEGREGVCVLLSGESGIGKTTLVQTFLQSLTVNAPVLLSGCEAFLTPRPFGPVVDLADRFSPSVALALQQGSTYNAIFPEVLRFFKESRQPYVFVIEDVHWADAGTIDLLRYLGRRLADVPLMLLLTHRDDSLDDSHPLHTLLGDLPTATTKRISLPTLSLEAVNKLAKAVHRDGDEIYTATGGNPFYVTEILASSDRSIPPSIRDAVRSALARLPPAARTFAEWVSLFPGQTDRSLLYRVAKPRPEDIENCLDSGMLKVNDNALLFRHELARIAVYQSQPQHRREARHGAIFVALNECPAAMASMASLVHHAEGASLHVEVARLAPMAARAAATSGAHREAARLYGLALSYHSQTDAVFRASLLEARAHACMLSNQHGAAIEAREQADKIHRAQGDLLKTGVNLGWLARLHWFVHGSDLITYKLAEQAVEVLQVLPANREYALACSSLAQMYMAADRLQPALKWAQRAIETADLVGNPEALASALHSHGYVRLRMCDEASAWVQLERSLQTALEHHLEYEAARAYTSLFAQKVMHNAFDQGMAYACEGLHYCESRGLHVVAVRLLIRRAYVHILMGDWARAECDLAEAVVRYSMSPMEATTHEFVSAILVLRRGIPAAAQRLADAVAGMRKSGIEFCFLSTSAALAESAWLEGKKDDIATLVRPALDQLLQMGDIWRAGELAVWLSRGAVDVDVDLPALLPAWQLEVSGDWRTAAEQWRGAGSPYQAALALCSGDEIGLREALDIFDQLGAMAAAKHVRQMLHETGVRDIPRGPYLRTRTDPLGLTAHERTVFEMLQNGLGNAAIGERMHRSVRTVEHHVAAVFQKVGVNSRVQLMARFPLERPA
jgi:DNA-binding CsgD family transcriptional regulator/tetratricopeptide (TPR) repeat protein